LLYFLFLAAKIIHPKYADKGTQQNHLWGYFNSMITFILNMTILCFAL